MKRTLKESVRDIRKMIGRIDHATIVEAPEPVMKKELVMKK